MLAQSSKYFLAEIRHTMVYNISTDKVFLPLGEINMVNIVLLQNLLKLAATAWNREKNMNSFMSQWS